MAAKKKNVVYKETSVFELFPSFTYTKRQKSRIILYHCYAKNIVKMIRYAANFDVPNKLSLIYVVGQPKQEKIMQTLEQAGCSSNVCVCTSMWTDEWQTVYERYDTLRRHCVGVGEWDKTQDCPNDLFWKNRRAFLAWDAIDGTTRRHDELEQCGQIVREYQQLKLRCARTVFKNFRCYRLGALPKPYEHDRLDTLICKVFPCGAEALSVNDIAAISPAGMERGVSAVVSQDTAKLLRMKVDDHTPAVKAIRRLLNKRFRDQRPCSLGEIQHLIMSPPYGLIPCEYSAACVAYAMLKYQDRCLLLWDTITTHDYWDESSLAGALCGYIFPVGTGRRLSRRDLDKCYLFIESHPHKALKQALHEIFGVPMRTPSMYMFMDCRKNLESSRRLPLMAIDRRLYDLLNCGFYWWDAERLSALADDTVRSLHELKHLYEEYCIADTEMPNASRAMYSSAAPWAWRETMTFEHTTEWKTSSGRTVQIREPQEWRDALCCTANGVATR